jgi:hypothetical protein
MANVRALTRDTLGYGTQEIADADVLRIGNITPASGNLTIGGFTGSNVVVATGQTLGISGATGGINLTSGADLSAAAGSILSGFDSIEGITSGNLVDKSAAETITGQWTFQAAGTTNPKLIVKAAASGQTANDILFQVQTSAGANLFSVDLEGDVVIAGGETVAGATIYTGDVTLGDGGNTIQVGSAATPAVGDNVYINTTGTSNGSFSITTTNYTVNTSGDQAMGGNLTLTAGGSVTTTSNGNLTLATHGTGTVNITSDVLLTSLDIGTSGSPMASLYATTIYGTLDGDGTNNNVWVTNLNAALATDEDSIIVSAAGDGTALQAWRWFNDSTAKTFMLQYAEDPAALNLTTTAYDLTVLTADSAGTVDFGYNVNANAGLDVTGAALTVDASGIDCAGGIDLDGALGFDGVTASSINTSGNNPLSITVGTNTLDVTAGLVDLRTAVTALDVPSGTAFMIGGTALTAAGFTATNVDTLLDGSNADALHTHAAATATKVEITGLNTTACTSGYGAYISASNTAASAICKPSGSSFKSATFAGVCDIVHGSTGSLIVNGTTIVQFETGLTVAAGEPALLSMLAGGTSGKFTNTPASAAAGSFITRVGTILSTSTYGTDQKCTILIQAQSPVSV